MVQRASKGCRPELAATLLLTALRMLTFAEQALGLLALTRPKGEYAQAHARARVASKKLSMPSDRALAKFAPYGGQNKRSAEQDRSRAGGRSVRPVGVFSYFASQSMGPMGMLARRVSKGAIGLLRKKLRSRLTRT